MKHSKIKKTLFIIIISLLSNLSLAHSSKIGLINLEKIFNESPQIEKIKLLIEKENIKNQEVIKDKTDKLRVKFNKYEKIKENKKATTETLTKLELNLLKMDSDIKEIKQKQQQELEEFRKNEFLKFEKLVMDITKKISNKNKYEIIFSSRLVFYHNDDSDITDKVLDKIISLYK